MPSREEVLEGARKIGERYADELRKASKNPDLDLISKYREICKKADKSLDDYFEDNEVIDSYARNKAAVLVFTDILLKSYNEVIEQRKKK